MSEITDRVIKQIIERIENNVPFIYCDEDELAKIIVSIPELAVVNRGAALPENPYHGIQERLSYIKAQQDMLKEGWVKEVKDD